MRTWWPMPVTTRLTGVPRQLAAVLDRLADSGVSGTAPAARRGWFGAAIATVWLFVLAAPISQRWGEGQHARVVAVMACVVVFGVLIAIAFMLFPQHGWDGWGEPRRADRRAWLLLAVMSVPTAVTMLLLGGAGITMLMYLSSVSIFVLPGRMSARVVFGIAIAMLAAAVVAPVLRAGGIVIYLCLIPILIWCGRQIGLRGRRRVELERRQRAELAIAEDRNRVARDVHDILGHSLTVITVKTELAQRLIDLDPGRAKVEMADVERLAREALAGVRETVGGLREVSLSGELANARTVLHAAAIDADLPEAFPLRDELPSERGTVFGWVLREAITNIVRHSAATHCAVRVSSSCLEVIDNGTGLGADAEFGSGLEGLRERVRAAGGTLTLSATRGGGLRVTAAFPEQVR